MRFWWLDFELAIIIWPTRPRPRPAPAISAHHTPSWWSNPKYLSRLKWDRNMSHLVYRACKATSMHAPLLVIRGTLHRSVGSDTVVLGCSVRVAPWACIYTLSHLTIGLYNRRSAKCIVAASHAANFIFSPLNLRSRIFNAGLRQTLFTNKRISKQVWWRSRD